MPNEILYFGLIRLRRIKGDDIGKEHNMMTGVSFDFEEAQRILDEDAARYENTDPEFKVYDVVETRLMKFRDIQTVNAKKK